MHRRQVYNANFLIGALRHRVTRAAYSEAEMLNKIRTEFPEALSVKIQPVR